MENSLSDTLFDFVSDLELISSDFDLSRALQGEIATFFFSKNVSKEDAFIAYSHVSILVEVLFQRLISGCSELQKLVEKMYSLCKAK